MLPFGNVVDMHHYFLVSRDERWQSGDVPVCYASLSFTLKI